MAKKDEVWVLAHLLTEGDQFDDEGRFRVVQSVSYQNPEVVITCVDGTVVSLLGRTPVRLWENSPSDSEEEWVPWYPDEIEHGGSSLEDSELAVAAEEVVTSSQRPEKPTTRSYQRKDRTSEVKVEQVQSVDGNEIERLTTITTVVEYILWGLLGLTILGSVIAATRTQSSVCGETLASATTCESYPYIIPSIAAAVIATAFYLFAIAIMRAIRLWAQRLAAGLPV